MHLEISNSAIQAESETSSERIFVGLPDAARLTGVPLSTLHVWIQIPGKIPSERIAWHKTRRKIDLEWLRENARDLYERQPTLHIPGGLLIKRHVSHAHAGEGRAGRANVARPTPDLLALARAMRLANRIWRGEQKACE